MVKWIMLGAGAYLLFGKPFGGDSVFTSIKKTFTQQKTDTARLNYLKQEMSAARWANDWGRYRQLENEYTNILNQG